MWPFISGSGCRLLLAMAEDDPITRIARMTDSRQVLLRECSALTLLLRSSQG